MMTHLLRGTALCGALLATLPATAQQFAGGQVDLDYNSFRDSDISSLTARGSGELAFSRNLSLQGDVALSSSDNSGISNDATGFTLHGVYHVSPVSSVGTFFTIESSDGGADYSSLGVEVGGNFGTVGTELWFAVAEAGDSDVNGRYGGIDVRVPMGSAAFVSKFQYFNFEDQIEVARLGLGAEYTFDSVLSVTAMVEGNAYKVTDSTGTFSITDDDSSIRLGATYRFGKRPGTVFGSRSVFDAFR